MNKKLKENQVDWVITLLPLIMITILCGIFFIAPDKSNEILSKIRFILGDTVGSYYLIIGLGIFLFSIYIAYSKYGNIILGNANEKPKYSFFTWGSMMFTCGLAADILFYSFAEWVMYASEPYILTLGTIQEWVPVFPIFHWSLIPWGFYLVLAVSFGFMLHIRKIDRQRFSEACRPILGKYIDDWFGRIIDLIAVFGLIAGTATTFSVATPLMATIVNIIFKIEMSRKIITIIILIITCIVYTYSLLHGFKGIAILAKSCIYLFFLLLLFVLLFGGQTQYILDTGFSSLGKMIQNFIELSTYTDPLRKNLFPQNWTIYYWAYWIVWCVAAPFFIGNISKGRTIRQVIIGGYTFGAGSTILSFIILGNYSMGLEMKGMASFLSEYEATGDIYLLITNIIKTLPLSSFVLVLVLVTMITFYATSFDSIALIASYYSYHRLENEKEPHKMIQLMWCVLLILLPVALIFSESSMNNLQSVSIIAAFPLGIIIVMIVVSFFKEVKDYREKNK